MSTATREASRFAGAPVELYTFVKGAANSVPAGSVAVAERFGYADGTARDVAWTTSTDLGTATVSGGILGAPLLVLTEYTGGLVGTGHAYDARTITGLNPAVTYTLLAQVRKSGDPGPFQAGVGFSGRNSDGSEHFFLDSNPNWPASGFVNVSIPARPTSGGELTIAVGAFAIQYGWTPTTFTVPWIALTQPLSGFSGATATTVRLVSSKPDYTFDGNLYTETVMTRSAVQRGGVDSGPNEIEVTLPRDHTVSLWVRDGLPGAPITCTVRRTQRGETDVIVLANAWRVSNARFEGPSCVLTLASVRSEFTRKLPRFVTQATCPFALYDTLCQASEPANTYTGTVTSIDGLTVEIDGAADAANGRTDPTLFNGGVLVAPDGTRVGIRSTALDTDGTATDFLTLSRPLTLTVSDDIALIAGCDKAVTTCHRRFGNTVHFGGEPVMPDRNPFTGAGLP